MPCKSHLSTISYPLVDLILNIFFFAKPLRYYIVYLVYSFEAVFKCKGFPKICYRYSEMIALSQPDTLIDERGCDLLSQYRVRCLVEACDDPVVSADLFL